MGDRCGKCSKYDSGRCEEYGKYVGQYDDACEDYEE